MMAFFLTPYHPIFLYAHNFLPNNVLPYLIQDSRTRETDCCSTLNTDKKSIYNASYRY